MLGLVEYLTCASLNECGYGYACTLDGRQDPELDPIFHPELPGYAPATSDMQREASWKTILLLVFINFS